jgi:uncharacterized protein YkwD
MRRFIAILAAILVMFSISAQRPLWDGRSWGLAEMQHLSPELQHMAIWMNMARTQPKDFAQLVFGPTPSHWPKTDEDARTLTYDWIGSSGKETKQVVVYWFPSDDFEQALKELYETLMTMGPLPALRIQKAMEPALMAHLKFLARTSSLSHTGEKGSKSHDRIKSAVPQAKETGENLIMGIETPESALISLLLDDGVPSRGHRHNLLSPAFTHMAVAQHEVYWGQVFCRLE